MIIMSNNIWKCDGNCEQWLAQGWDCSAETRSKGLVKAYLSVLPDVIGFQEMSEKMQALLHRQLLDQSVPYAVIAGKDTPIFYRSDKLLLLDSGFFLYDEAVPGLEGSFNNQSTKSYCYGVFEEKATKKKLIVLTTHLWWKDAFPEGKNYQAGSGEARVYQIGLAAEKCRELCAQYHCPALLMGDFNDKYPTPTVQSLLEKGWRHTHDICIGETCQTAGYHYCFGDGWRHDPPGEFADSIDHILIYNGGESEIKAFLRLEEAFYEPLSDHFPVYINIKL